MNKIGQFLRLSLNLGKTKFPKGGSLKTRKYGNYNFIISNF